MTDLNPLSQLQVEEEIGRLSKDLTIQTQAHAFAAERAAQADVDYKLAQARAWIARRGKGGTVPEKEAEVLVEVAEYFKEAKLTEAVLKAAQEKGRNLRTQLEALRSINANVRDAVAHSSGRGG